jgi:hypothetical protein
MLTAAGIDTSGPRGAVRIAGLSSVYASVFRIWLEDEDPGLARTMAALDRRLRSGERTLTTVEDVLGGIERLGNIFKPRPRNQSNSEPATATSEPHITTPPAAEPPPAPPMI